jgi:hypothetical protein
MRITSRELRTASDAKYVGNSFPTRRSTRSEVREKVHKSAHSAEIFCVRAQIIPECTSVGEIHKFI